MKPIETDEQGFVDIVGKIYDQILSSVGGILEDNFQDTVKVVFNENYQKLNQANLLHEDGRKETVVFR